MVEGRGDGLFRNIKAIVGIAKRLKMHPAKIDLERQHQLISFAAYQLVYASKFGVSIIPKSAHALNFAMSQARVATRTSELMKSSRCFEDMFCKGFHKSGGRRRSLLLST